ncbi:chalcone--flavonone isomerase-like [Cucurbita moschata]|uniref:Chalcone-flavonone isomerase family protein n=1 Tax=Cucurbita moschata TaxID=3662 RepID=A0A6J1FEB6_CUCMO|nr:chalcone--flavonone isomerase-like [Cucurbita moschata]
MASVSDLNGIQVENVKFPEQIKPPASAKTLFLGGAGVRELEVEGNSVKFTAIGVYLEKDALPLLAGKWKGKSAAELMDSDEFFRDIVTGPFEKFTNVTMIRPLTGQQYAEKVAENCEAAWKSMGMYTEEGAEAIKKFIDAFKSETFPAGSSILFTHLPPNTLSISFSKDGSIPEQKEGMATIESKLLSESVLASIICKDGVSPAARLSLATRFSQFSNNI